MPQQVKVHHYAKLEHGYGRNRWWETKEFSTIWEAEKYLHEYKKEHFCAAGYTYSETEVIGRDIEAERSEAYVGAYLKRMWNL